MSTKLPVTCIYWQQGRCFKDERSCRFIHGAICRYDPCKREDCDRVHLKHGRDRDRGFGGRQDSRYRRSPNRYQNDKRYNRSPKRYRSRSPRGNRSPQRYKSPNNRQGSRSPNPKKYSSRSPNPKRYDSRSPNPKRYESRSPNPTRFSRSLSPVSKNRRSRSPNAKRYASRSPNPVRYSRSASPNPKRYSRSPNPKRYSRSPNLKRYSRSPNTKNYRSRSPNTKKYSSRSPNPKRYGSQSPNQKRFDSRSPNPLRYGRSASRSPNPLRYGRSESPRNRIQSPSHNRSLSPNQRQRHDSGHKSSISPRRERSPTPKKKKKQSPKLLASPSPERHGSDSTVHELSPPVEKNSKSKWKKVERSPSETRGKSSSPENKRSRSPSPMSPETRNIQSDEEYERSRSSSKDERKYKNRDGIPNENRDRSPMYTRDCNEDRSSEEKDELSSKNSSWSSKPADISSELRNLVASLSNSKFAELSKVLEIRDKLSSGNMKRSDRNVSAVEGLEEVGEEVEGIFDGEEQEEKEKPQRNREVDDGVNPSPPHHSRSSSRNSKRDVDVSYKSDWDLKSAIENPSQPMEKVKPPPVKNNKGGKGELWTPALDRRREAKAQMKYAVQGGSNPWEVETPYVNRDLKRKSASEDTQSSDVSDKSMAPPKIAEMSSAGKLLSSLMSHGGKVTDIPSSLTQVMPSPMVDSRASSKGQKSAQTIIDELLEKRARDSPKNRQSPSHVERHVKSGKDIKEMGYGALEKSLSNSSDLVKTLLRSKSRSVSPDEQISRKSSYDSSSGKTRSKRAKEMKKRKPSTSSSDSSSSEDESRNIEKEKHTRENEKKKDKYKDGILETQLYDDLKRQRESLLRKIKLFRGQKCQLNEQKEDIIRNHRGDDDSLEHLLDENSGLQKEIGKQILNMSHMLRDIDEQMDDIKENRISEKSERHRRDEDFHQNDDEEKYRRERKEVNEKYRKETEDKYQKESEDRYQREVSENYRRGEDKYLRGSEDRYRREPSPRRESRREMSPQRRDRRNDSPYYRDERRSNERNIYMETEVPYHKRSHSPHQKRSGSPRSPVVTSRHQRSPDRRRSQSPPSKRQLTGKDQGMERYPKSRKTAPLKQSESEDGEDPEEYGPVPSQKQYIRYTDAGMHWCKLCTHFSDSIPDYADHLMSSDHLSKVKVDRKTWVAKAPKVEKDVKPPNVEYVTLPVQGVEFIHAMSAFYCSLCDFFMRDKQEMFSHPESKKHINNYKIHQSKNPMYETTYTKAKGTFYAKFKLEEQRKFFEEKRKAKDEATARLKEKESNFERSRRQGSIERLREETEDYEAKVEKDEYKSYGSIRVATRAPVPKSEADNERTEADTERTEDEAYWYHLSSSAQKKLSHSKSTTDSGKASVTKPLIEPKKIDVKIDADAITEKDKGKQKRRESKSGQQSSTKSSFIGKMPFLRRKVGSKDDDPGSRNSSGKRMDSNKDRSKDSKDDETESVKKSVEKTFTENLEKNLSEFLKNKIDQKKKDSESSPAAMSDESDEDIEVLDPRSLIPPSVKPAVPNVTGRRKQMLEAASSGIIKAQDKETKLLEEKIQETKLEEKIKKSSQIGSTSTETANTNDSPIPLDIPLPSIMTCMPDPKTDSKDDWGNVIIPDIGVIQDHESQATSSLSTVDYNMQMSYGVPPPIMTSMSMMTPSGMPGDCDLSKPPPGINMDMHATVEGEDIYRPCDMEVEDIMDYKAMTPPPPGTETPPPPGCATPPPPGTTPPRMVTPPPPGTESFIGSQTPPPPGTSPDKSTEYSSNRHTGGQIPRNIPFENKINELKEQSLVLESIFKEAPHFEVATSIFKKPKSTNSSEMENTGDGNTEEKDDFQREMEELVKHKLKELKGSSEDTTDKIAFLEDDSNIHSLIMRPEKTDNILIEEYTDRNKGVEVSLHLEVEEGNEETEAVILEESVLEKKSPSGVSRGRGKKNGKKQIETDYDNASLMENKIKSPARGRRQIPKSTIVKSDTEEDSRDDSPSKAEESEVKRSVRGRRLTTKCHNDDELEEESLPTEMNIKKSAGKKSQPVRVGIKESEDEDDEEDSVNEVKPKQLPPRSRKPSARAAAAAAVVSTLDSDEDEMEEVAKSPRKRGRKPSIRVTTDEGEEDTEDAATAVTSPSKRTSRKKTPAVMATVNESVDEEEEDKIIKPTKRTRRQPARSAIVESAEEDELQEENITSNKRSRRTRR